MRFHTITIGVFLTCLSISNWMSAATAHDYPRENPISAMEIMEQCGGGTQWCEGYISGMVDGMLDVESMNKRIGNFCLPRGTNTNEMKNSVRAYLKKHSEKKNEKNGALLIMDALHTKYPCKAQ